MISSCDTIPRPSIKQCSPWKFFWWLIWAKKIQLFYIPDFLHFIWWSCWSRKSSPRTSSTSPSFGSTRGRTCTVRGERRYFECHFWNKLKFHIFDSADFGIETSFTSTISSITRNCVWTGPGRWRARCNSSWSLHSYYSSMPSNISQNVQFWFVTTFHCLTYIFFLVICLLCDRLDEQKEIGGRCDICDVHTWNLSDLNRRDGEAQISAELRCAMENWNWTLHCTAGANYSIVRGRRVRLVSALNSADLEHHWRKRGNKNLMQNSLNIQWKV